MALAQPPSLSSYPHTSIHNSREYSWDCPVKRKHLQKTRSSKTSDTSRSIDLASPLDGHRIEGIETVASLKGVDIHGLVSEKTSQAEAIIPIHKKPTDNPQKHTSTSTNQNPKGPFQKWIRALYRRASRRSASHEPKARSQSWENTNANETNTRSLRHKLMNRRSSSGSSLGFVAAIKSASISLISASVMARSQRNTRRSRGLSKTDRSSRASCSALRFSEDNMSAERVVAVDTEVTQRALQRRQILEELVDTEESYIRDIRFLVQVYITILAALPSLSITARSSINRNLNEIITLHEEILGDLHRAIPHSEYNQLDLPHTSDRTISNGHHRRWWSVDTTLGHYKRVSLPQSAPGMLSEPQVAADVAKIFSKKMNRFFIYKEYGAKYEKMIKDVALANEDMPEWETYQKGLEALASSLRSPRTYASTKKSLTIGDLLVKPIQRVCKYPLLFAELLKCTPVCDCPNSHMEVETALMRLREATTEINRATNDGEMRETLERTWLLQDRLVFPERKLDADSKNQIRSFGLVQLCGTLHVCWQTDDGVQGQYMICLLYNDILCLASAGKVDQIYTIQACINLHAARVEDVDNGRGLQCHTAPFSWKLVFEGDHQLYELIMSACSAKEELKWREQLYRPPSQLHDSKDARVYSPLSLNMKSLGLLYGNPGTVARRQSFHRATTIGPKSPLCQVIVKNTSVATTRVSSSTSLNRSQSLLTTNSRVPILAPTRSERMRVETLLGDVWSRDSLPYPGMVLKTRSDHLVLNSASTMMRKLSVASITGSFSKKPGPNSPQCPNTQSVDACDETTQRGSNSSEVVPDCKEGMRVGSGRLTKKPRTQSVLEKEEDTQHTASETVQKMNMARLVTDVKGFPDDKIETSTLETPSTFSLKRNSSLYSLGSESVSMGKENAYFPMSFETKKLGRRWGRSSGSRNDGTGQGLRNIFR